MRGETKLPMRTIALRTLAVTGMISVGLVAPKMLKLMDHFDKGAKRRKNLYNNIRITLWRLERDGLIKTFGEPGRRSVELTAKGQQIVDSVFAAEYQIPEPILWDGRWRIVMFDLSERRKKARDTLRRLLSNAGFVRLQDSVWVHPYPCDEFIELVRAHLRSGTGELQYFVAEALESDKALRTHFELP